MTDKEFLKVFLSGVTVGIAAVNLITSAISAVAEWYKGKMKGEFYDR